MKVTHSEYTQEGRKLATVLLDGMPIIAATEDSSFAAEYARSVYHNHKGSAVFTHWNGDSATETTLDRK